MMASSLISLVFISSSQPIPLSYHTTFTVRKLTLTHFIIYSSHFFKTFPLATVSFTAKDPARVHGLHVVVVSLRLLQSGTVPQSFLTLKFLKSKFQSCRMSFNVGFSDISLTYGLCIFSKNIAEVALCCDLSFR